MFKDNILDTLIFEDSKILFKHLHVARTLEAFQFLNINVAAQIENIYDELEKLYAEKWRSDDCLRLVFFTQLPLTYKAEVLKIQKLHEVIRLNTVPFINEPGPESAFKWENREHWNSLLKEKKNQADDILAVNARYEIIEASRFNIFSYDESSQMVYTPKLESGCLNGVLRRFTLIEGTINLPDRGNKKIIEQTITLDELSFYQLYVGNSVRGVLKATLI